MVTSERRKWLALGLLATVQFMVVLDIAIVNVAAGSGFWNSTSPSGSHASGETGRRICRTGSNAALNTRDRPSMKPSGVPISSASVNPFATRISEYQVKRKMP